DAPHPSQQPVGGQILIFDRRINNQDLTPLSAGGDGVGEQRKEAVRCQMAERDVTRILSRKRYQRGRRTIALAEARRAQPAGGRRTEGGGRRTEGGRRRGSMGRQRRTNGTL